MPKESLPEPKNLAESLTRAQSRLWNVSDKLDSVCQQLESPEDPLPDVYHTMTPETIMDHVVELWGLTQCIARQIAFLNNKVFGGESCGSFPPLTHKLCPDLEQIIDYLAEQRRSLKNFHKNTVIWEDGGSDNEEFALDREPHLFCRFRLIDLLTDCMSKCLADIIMVFEHEAEPPA
jgi:hypothetical protein